ncbi:unnamed protein product [Plutella xylostella]|uniref:(diamondback moth) hypothetical protein n=1 Tax=Plutella xylostella TaxID=51655 RepID=A0A8S4GFA5_PLUXY|nr:unnamed protein product [Plutella xylostella]
MGKHGIGNINDNGQRLLELCATHQLCVTNTYFKNKPAHKVSWKHPRSGHWHQLDLIITRRRDLRDTLNSRAYHSAICDTDHALVIAKTRLTSKKFHASKTKNKRQAILNIPRRPDEAQLTRFHEFIEKHLSDSHLKGIIDLETLWNKIKVTLLVAAKRVFGKKAKEKTDWYSEFEELLQPLVEAKRKAHINLVANGNDHTKSAFKIAKANLQRTARQCANQYWIDLCTSIQHCHDMGDIRGMHQGIKRAMGPVARKRATIKDTDGSPISDKSLQLDRWARHYINLYFEEVNISPEAARTIPHFPTLESLDTPPTFAEFLRALQALKTGKSTGSDNIPAELIKLPAATNPLYVLLLRCWEMGTVPQEMRDANIVTLYKGKGDRGVCDNYRGISLLSVVGKAFARVILSRLHILANRVYPESQCGFRANRSTTDMIFTLRQLQEKCREQRKPLFMAFVDLNKAFDTVSRNGLYEVLNKVGCPPKMLALIKSFHDNMRGCVVFDGDVSAAFDVNRGVRQGCVLAPTLFGIFFSALLSAAFDGSEEGVHLHTRHDGKLFNINLLKAKRNRLDLLVRELLFADDAAIVANTEEELQHLVTRFGRACDMFSMSVNTRKTVVMAQGTTIPPTITLNESTLQVVDHFCYLGSTTTSNLSNDKEIDSRIGRASTAFGKLYTRVWRNSKLTTRTKVLVYNSCVLSTLLYGSETWTTYRKQERRINAFHMRCLRIIIGVSWRDKVTNECVLNTTRTTSITAILKQRRLQWLGHVQRQDTERLPRSVMLGQLANATRPVGRPLLRFKDSCKRDMDDFEIDKDNWESLALDRPVWSQLLHQGKSKHDGKWLEKLKTKRLNQHLEASPNPNYACVRCGKQCKARIGLFSHMRKCGSQNPQPL